MFVRSYNPIWYFVNLQGVQMDDTYYFFVLENDFPYLPSPVYHDPEHTIPWNFPIQLLPNGTLPQDIYYDPNLVYRLEWRRGNTQADQLIYRVQDYVPSNSGSTPTPGESIHTDNQISNSQFAFVDFNPSLTITTAGTYQIAPGWFLKLTGTGTVSTTITREPIAGDQHIYGNPPYRLRIQNTGWTEALLYQRFQNVSGIWYSTTNEIMAVNASITGISESGTLPVTLSIVPSTGTSQQIATGNFNNSAYSVIGAGVQMPQSTNSDSGDSAFVDFVITLPPIGTLKITNVQVVAGDASLITDNPLLISYIEESIERQEDHLFHYYADSLIREPKDSILTGWNFAQNPWQFRTTSSSNVANNTYTADQTIIVQQAYVAAATANNIAVAQGSLANNYGFTVTAVTATNQFAMIQYIDPATVRPYWNSVLSSLVKAFINTSHSTTCRIKMKLIYRASLPSTISQTEPVASWTALGEPVFAAGWTALTPLNDPIYTLTSTPTEFSFDGFTLPVSTNAAMTLGIVLYTMDAMNQNATADFLVVNDVSLVANDFALASNPLSFDETLRRCQYYYEKSLALPTLVAGAATEIGQKVYPTQLFDDGAGQANVYKGNFSLEYRQYKRAIPTVTFYSPATGTAARIAVGVWGSGGYSAGSPTDLNVSEWTAHGASNTGVGMFSNNVNISATIAFTIGFQGTMTFHYTADARLGI